jgi:hypothetical protein
VLELPKRLYYYAVPGRDPQQTGYPHMVIALGEGLKQLGVELFANVDFWRISPEQPDTLFRHDPAVSANDCAIVVLTEDWFHPDRRPFPPQLFDSRRRQLFVYFDSAEDSPHSIRSLPWTSEFAHFDFIFKHNCCRGYKYPANLRPWANGLSERMLRQLDSVPDYRSRQPRTINNFRPTKWKHSVRKATERLFNPRIARIFPVDSSGSTFVYDAKTPYEDLMWRQTGRRHSPAYFETLRTSAACAAFSGFFVAPWSRNPVSRSFRMQRQVLYRTGWRSSRSVEWDSWRFWEALAAGCAVFHLDLGRYGAHPPVQPESWRHYIGVNLEAIDEVIDRIGRDPDVLDRVATEGRRWVLEHYAPRPTAIRFLQVLGDRLRSRVAPELMRGALSHSA